MNISPNLRAPGMRFFADGRQARQGPNDIPDFQARFDEYHAEVMSMRGDITELQSGLDGMAGNIAGLRVGGGGDVINGRDGTTREALENFQAWVQFGPRAEMHTSSDPEGGFTTTPEIDRVIAQYAEDQSPMRRLARIVNTTSGEFKIVFNTGQAASGWTGERDARPETDSPSFSGLEFPTFEIYAAPRITQTLLDDTTFSLDDFLRDEVSKEFTREENAAFASGDGWEKPRGLLTYDTSTAVDSARAFGTLEYIPSGAAGAFPANDADALVTTVYQLKAQYRANAWWQMNSATAGVVRKIKNLDGDYIWRDGLIQGQPATLLGHPVAMNEDMPDIGANSLSIAFGDFRAGYLIIDRVGIRLLRDPFTNKPYVIFYSTKRVGGGLVDSRAIKLVKFAAS